MSPLPEVVNIVEVGPRDGLQNEAQCLSVAEKLEFIRQLTACGHQQIECGSFVSSSRVPQMADTDMVFKHLPPSACRYTALAPNLRGAQNAIAAGVKEIAVFTATTNSFTQRNQGCNQSNSLNQISEVIGFATQHKIPVRGYISCIVACPYDGQVSPKTTAALAGELINMGCNQISLGDTTGVATPGDIKQLLNCISANYDLGLFAGHFHNTLGQGLANCLQALDMGVRVFDTSVAGLGGCPFAGGRNGNLATEDLVYMLHGMGIKTGLDLPALVATGNDICQRLSRPNHSMVGRNQHSQLG